MRLCVAVPCFFGGMPMFDTVDKAGYCGACGLEYSPRMKPEESLAEAKRLFGKM